MVELRNIKECPECGSTNIRYLEKKDSIVCLNCGDIFEELTPEQEAKFEKLSEAFKKE